MKNSTLVKITDGLRFIQLQEMHTRAEARTEVLWDKWMRIVELHGIDTKPGTDHEPRNMGALLVLEAERFMDYMDAKERVEFLAEAMAEADR